MSRFLAYWKIARRMMVNFHLLTMLFPTDKCDGLHFSAVLSIFVLACIKIAKIPERLQSIGDSLIHRLETIFWCFYLVPASKTRFVTQIVDVLVSLSSMSAILVVNRSSLTDNFAIAESYCHQIIFFIINLNLYCR